MTSSRSSAAAAKPLAWLIMQSVMGPAVPCLLVGGAFLAPWAASQAPRGDGSLDNFVYVLFGSLAVWALAIFVTVWRRMPAARWVGGAFIALLILLGMLLMWDGISHRRQDNAASPLLLATILAFTLLACFWLYTYAFSPRVKRYIGRA